MYVWRDISDTSNYDDNIYTASDDTTLARYHTRLAAFGVGCGPHLIAAP